MTKKQLIMEEALKLFAEKGFELTSIQQITDACGISKGAFYLSYKSKDELISSMIDYFMSQLVIEVDQSVKGMKDDEEILYEFYCTILSTFHKHVDLARFFIKEQSKSFNQELFLKTHIYVQEMDKIILSIAERLYGETIEQTKYDLVYAVKGLINTYAQLFVFYKLPVDLDALAKSLVEKTNILAQHMKLPFLTNRLPALCENLLSGEVTKEEILMSLEKNINEVEQSIEKDSLLLLKDELLEPTFSRAIVKGLIGNIKDHPECRWVAYLLEKHLAF